jgi:uridylate kinase
MDLIKNKRILIKLSGAALGNKDDALDYDAIDRVAQVLITLQKRGAQLAIVVGGGNIFRGRSCDDMDRNIADNMGMLATTINSLALQDSIVRQNGKSTVMSAIDMYQICETFTQRHADELLNAGQIVIFAGGTGCPFFSTDTAAALRAAQIKANMLLLAKDVDGVYDKDPKCNAMHANLIISPIPNCFQGGCMLPILRL